MSREREDVTDWLWEHRDDVASYLTVGLAALAVWAFGWAVLLVLVPLFLVAVVWGMDKMASAEERHR